MGKPADGARSALSAGLDDVVRYWLCCGSTVFPHGAESCHEAQTGHPERVRFGTAKEHGDWQKNESSNAESATVVTDTLDD